MNEKRTYIWKLATFLSNNDKVMSGEELADHLNRNEFLTEYGSEYKGTRGTYTLIRETWRWLNDELELPEEAEHVAKAFVKPDGTYAYK
jgi:hypothetical protein